LTIYTIYKTSPEFAAVNTVELPQALPTTQHIKLWLTRKWGICASLERITRVFKLFAEERQAEAGFHAGLSKFVEGQMAKHDAEKAHVGKSFTSRSTFLS
jgi:hypothetical protein